MPRMPIAIDLERAIRLYTEEGCTLQEIAAAMGVERSVINRRLKKAGVEMRRRGNTAPVPKPRPDSSKRTSRLHALQAERLSQQYEAELERMRQGLVPARLCPVCKTKRPATWFHRTKNICRLCWNEYHRNLQKHRRNQPPTDEDRR